MTKLASQLREFHEKFGHHMSDGPPTVPPEHVVRLRARLIIEEACEALEAMFADYGLHHQNLMDMKRELKELCLAAPVEVDMPALADALGDTDYVVEGTRLAFGISGEPVADAIHASNMAKSAGKDAHGKTIKPAGWQPPDVARELRQQGWKG